MRDGLLDLPSLGQAAGFVTTPLRFVTFVYLFSVTQFGKPVKPSDLSICTHSVGLVFRTGDIVAWLDLPPREIHRLFCEHLFQFFGCHTHLDRFVRCLVIDVEHLFIDHADKTILLLCILFVY